MEILFTDNLSFSYNDRLYRFRKFNIMSLDNIPSQIKDTILRSKKFVILGAFDSVVTHDISEGLNTISGEDFSPHIVNEPREINSYDSLGKPSGLEFSYALNGDFYDILTTSPDELSDVKIIVRS